MALNKPVDEIKKAESEQEIIELLSRFNPADVETISDKYQNTLLILASQAHCLPAVIKLTDMKARNFHTTNRYGFTAIHFANTQICHHMRDVLIGEMIPTSPLMATADAFAAKQQKKRAISKLEDYAKRRKELAGNDIAANVFFKEITMTRAFNSWKLRLQAVREQQKQNQQNAVAHANRHLKLDAFKEWRARAQASKNQKIVDAQLEKSANEFRNRTYANQRIS